MLKRLLLMVIVIPAMVFQLVGCAAGPRSIPGSYFQQDHAMSVEVVKSPHAPQMVDYGSGLFQRYYYRSRSAALREQIEGITGDTFRELLRQGIAGKLAGHFEIVREEAPLAAEITISRWDWFIPSTVFEMDTGSLQYHLRIAGTVKVYDIRQGRRTQIASAHAVTEQPVDNGAESDNAQEALRRAIEDFSTKVADVILKKRPEE